MVACNRRSILFLCAVLCVADNAPLQAVVIGSNTAVSQQALAIFPSTDSDNQMLGFAAFVNGFTLSGGGNCIFNSFYPIAGAVTLNGGTLSLSKDLVFQKGISFYNGGTITGNGRDIIFLDTDPLPLPVNTTIPSTVSLLTQYNTGQEVVSCDWSFDNNFLVAINSYWSIFGIYNFDGTTIHTAGTQSSRDNFTCGRWHPSLYLVATGSTSNDLQIWQYSVDSQSVTLLSQQNVSQTVNAVCWHPTGNYIAVGTVNGSDELSIYSFLYSTLRLVTQSNLMPSRTISTNALSWDATGSYLVAGTARKTGSGGDELLVYAFDGSKLTLNASVNLNITVNEVSYSPTGNYVAVGLATGADRLQIYAHDPVAGELTQITSASIGQSLAVQSVSWSPDGNYLAFGSSKGNGNEFNVYFFDPSAQTLTLVYSFNTVTTDYTVRWSPSGNFLALGDANNYLSIYNLSSGTSTLTFNAAKLAFNSDVTFNVPTTFQGSCAIDGSNHALQFGNQGSIVVGSGATLALKNLTLNNITASNFYCADGTATITFNNVELDLSASDYNFTTGSFNVVGLLHIMGPYGFNYQTSQASTVNSNGTLFVDQGSKFNYSPSVNANNLLSFADSTASFILHSATLQVSNAGLQLTKGYVEIDGKSYVINSGTQVSQGLILGDGISSANNVVVRILPEAQCLVSSGYIVDKSV